MNTLPSYIKSINFDPSIWGPHYWFFLHTISLMYPDHPNDITRKKYYDFIQNLPTFIPNDQLSKTFEKLLDKYPLSPYLDSKSNLVKWIHFIHNEINILTEKKHISINEFYTSYANHYKLANLKAWEYTKFKERVIYVTIITILLIIILKGGL